MTPSPNPTKPSRRKSSTFSLPRDVGGGFGHYAQGNDFAVHVGLGAACNAKVTVRWPDAKLTQQSFDVPAGYRFVVKQGQAPTLEP
jgi:hypothetical protein